MKRQRSSIPNGRATKRRRSRRNSNGPRNLLASSTAYSGPTRLPRSNRNMDINVVEMSNIFQVITNVAGVINNVIGNNQASFLDTVQYEGLYNEWRCISLTATYYPYVVNAVLPATQYNVCFGVIDNESATALTSITAAVNFASVKPFSLNERMTLTWKMNGIEDSSFTSNVSAFTAYFKYYGSALTASTGYGYIVTKAIFQYRGRD